MNTNLYFLESAVDETPTIGGFMRGADANSFDECFKEACDHLRSMSIDPMMDINHIIRNKDVANEFKSHMLSGIFNETAQRQDVDLWGAYSTMDKQAEQLFDNVTNQLVKESTTVGQLMPIKAIDYPILLKQHLALATKDVMQTEVTSSPIVKKQIERRWIVDNQTGERWEYPQCFFDQEKVQEIYDAGKGLPIKDTPVELPLFNFDIVSELTDAAVPEREEFSFNTKVVKAILEDGTEIPMNMYIDLHLNMWTNGVIDRVVKNADGEDVEVKDVLTGSVDFVTKKITLTSASGQVKQVVFQGYLSNEKNERAVSMDYTREEREWKIEDGHRMNVPYSVEELEDAKALLDIDLYKKTYDNIAGYLTDMEDNQIIKFLDSEFVKYSGIELDPLGFNSFVRECNFNCDSTIATTALPSEYIENMLKFTIDRFLIDLTETAKMEDMTFVIYGNPKYISLLGDKVHWVINNGQTTGGVRHNYSYGIMSTGNIKVQVVSALKFDAKSQLQRGLRVIPYPLNKEQMTFKHYKYTTHILTTQNSGYRAPDRPGGSMTNIMAVSRYESACIQGIQGHVTFSNDEFVHSKLISAPVGA